jgi:hypothetical protein
MLLGIESATFRIVVQCLYQLRYQQRAQQSKSHVQKLAASEVKFVMYWVLLACHAVSTGK